VLGAISRLPAARLTPPGIVAPGSTKCSGDTAAFARIAVAHLGQFTQRWGHVGNILRKYDFPTNAPAGDGDVASERRNPGRAHVRRHPNRSPGKRLVCECSDAIVEFDPSWVPREMLADRHRSPTAAR